MKIKIIIYHIIIYSNLVLFTALMKMYKLTLFRFDFELIALNILLIFQLFMIAIYLINGKIIILKLLIYDILLATILFIVYVNTTIIYFKYFTIILEIISLLSTIYLFKMNHFGRERNI